MKRKLVAVEWIDSAMTPGWRSSRAEVPTYAECRTVGYLIENSERHVAIAMNVNDDGGYGETMVIPREAVRRVRKVKLR